MLPVSGGIAGGVRSGTPDSVGSAGSAGQQQQQIHRAQQYTGYQPGHAAAVQQGVW